MFKRVLIANRGEIACRIIRTLKHLGCETIAVYSEEDAHALHVQLADKAFLLGHAAAKESYLHVQKVLAVAKDNGVEAIHPGYGFLSENAAFAEACKAAGIAFIGPRLPKTFARLGLKTRPVPLRNSKRYHSFLEPNFSRANRKPSKQPPKSDTRSCSKA